MFRVLAKSEQPNGIEYVLEVYIYIPMNLKAIYILMIHKHSASRV